MTPGSHRGRRMVLSIVLLLIAVPLAIWLLRHPIATHFVDRELRRRGVEASYRITEIGFGRQVLEDVRIGPRERPDLTARRVVVGTTVGLGGVGVSGLEATGVRLRGRVVGGRVRLGQIDRLLPPPSGKPFAFPDLPLTLSDTIVRLATPVGEVRLGVAGQGNPARDFTGRLAVETGGLAGGGCETGAISGRFVARVAEGRPALDGPLTVRSMSCGDGLVASGVRLAPDIALSKELNRVSGTVGLAADRLATEAGRAEALSGSVRLAGWLDAVSGRGLLSAERVSTGSGSATTVVLDGTFLGGPEALEGQARLSAATLSADGYRAERVAVAGRYDLAFGNGVEGAIDGRVSARAVTLSSAALSALDGIDGGLKGTPLAALAQALGRDLQAAGRRFALESQGTVAIENGTLDLHIPSARLASRSGARLAFGGGDGVRLRPGSGTIPTLDGVFTVAGGGLPAGTVRLRRDAEGALSGVARFDPYRAGPSRIALTPVRFSRLANGVTRIDTTVELSGPFAGGRVDGAAMRIAAAFDRTGGVVVNPGCADARFRTLAISGVAFDPARLRLCPVEGGALFRRSARGGVQAGAIVQAPALTGRVGATPVALNASRATVRIAEGRFAVDDLEARIGAAGAMTRLDFPTLSGGFLGRGAEGRFTGASGQVGQVPILWSEGEGDWSFAGGRLALTADLAVDDAADPARFETLSAPGFALAFAGSVIDAAGPLIDPQTGRTVTDVTLRHSFAEGGGEARLAVRNLRFDDELQPSRLTPLALGVVADVQGTVNGDARIVWGEPGVQSTGTFTTKGMNLAAAFGPVTGLSTTVRFTNLLNLVTADDQLLTVDQINPGVPVENGVVRYAIVSGRRIAVRSGRWPFAGGTLVLEPTTLEFGEGKRQDFTLDVTALDAAVLLDNLEFDNISATGVFDGRFPLSFANGNGEVVGGHLESRPPGGTVAYVGAVSQEDLGFFGNLTFEALKSLKYDQLDITLNGPLSGQMVTGLRFDGLAQGTGAKRNILARAIAGLPFVFKITITAPFRQLLFSARSFSDPELLVEQNLGLLYREQLREGGRDVPEPPPGDEPAPIPVQPHDSEPLP